MDSKDATKKEYETPHLVRHGDIEDLTRGSSGRDFEDNFSHVT
jgi:hypothetical protein